MVPGQKRRDILFLDFPFDGLQVRSRGILAIDVIPIPVQAPLIPSEIFVHKLRINLADMFIGDPFDDAVNS